MRIGLRDFGKALVAIGADCFRNNYDRARRLGQGTRSRARPALGGGRSRAGLPQHNEVRRQLPRDLQNGLGRIFRKFDESFRRIVHARAGRG